MPTEGQGKFFSLKNNAWVTQEKGVAVMSQTIVKNGDKDTNVQKRNKKTHNKTIKFFHTVCPK